MGRRVTFQVKDAEGKNAADAYVSIQDGETLGSTNENGVLVAYVPAGRYTFVGAVGNDTAKTVKKVKEACKVNLTAEAGSTGSGPGGSVRYRCRGCLEHLRRPGG